MLRNSFLVFIGCWIIWFLIDKPGSMQAGIPGRGDDFIGNFQYAFDMLKSGYPDLAFIFIWKQHFLVLSLLGGALLSVVSGVVGDWFGRRRMRRLVLPEKIVRKARVTESDEPGPVSTPAHEQDSMGDKRVQ